MNLTTVKCIVPIWKTAATLEKAQRYVDNGSCRRIHTDEQRDFYDREMYDIPNWLLRPTNTSGKR